MARSRGFVRQRRSGPPFRSWGIVLGAAAGIAAYNGAVLQFIVFVALWIVYVLRGRLTRCRVETMRGTPCRWRVRGLLGTCEYHLGDKRGLPILRPMGPFAIPQLMWPRLDLGPGVRLEPQPQIAVGEAAISAGARRPSLDLFMAIVSLLVATASLIRDLVAG